MKDSFNLPPDTFDLSEVEYFTEAQAGAWGEMLRAFARFIALPVGAALLDVGTGPGLFVRLAIAEGVRLAVGCDASRPMVARAAKLTAAIAEAAAAASAPAWLAGDALRLPVADAAFDAGVASNVLFLLPDPAAALVELSRVVRAHGIVALLNPTDEMSISSARRFAGARGLTGFAHFSFINYARLAEAHHRLSPTQWAALAQAAGLSELRAEVRAGGMVAFLRGTKR